MIEISREKISLDRVADADLVEEYYERAESGRTKVLSSDAQWQCMAYKNFQKWGADDVEDATKVKVVNLQDYEEDLKFILGEFESKFEEEDKMTREVELYLLGLIQNFYESNRHIIDDIVSAKKEYDMNLAGVDLRGNDVPLVDRLKMLFIAIPFNLYYIDAKQGISLDNLNNLLIRLIEYVTNLTYRFDNGDVASQYLEEGSQMLSVTESDLKISEMYEKKLEEYKKQYD